MREVPWGKMLGFALAVTPIMLTPGVSVALVTQRVVESGPVAGVRVAAGTAVGLLVHATAAVLGLAALLSESAAAFTVLRLLGAAYLIVLGLHALRSPQNDRSPARLPWSGHGGFVQGLLSNVLNPRAASVYLTLVPQFVSPGDDVLRITVALVTVHIAMQMAWLLAWTGLVARARRSFATGRLGGMFRQLSGAALLTLGVRTALQSRAR